MNDDRYRNIHKDFFKLYPGIELNQLREIEIFNKNYFLHRQKEIRAIFNSGLVDEYFGFLPKENILWIHPNSIIYDTGKRVMVGKEKRIVAEGRFYLYEIFAKHILPVLTAVDIYRENEGLTHPINQVQYLALAERFVKQNNLMFVSGDFYAGAGDGFVHNDTESGGGSNWTDCRNNTTGLNNGATSMASGRGIASCYAYSSFFAINREFYPVDLSSIGAGAVFSAGTLNVYGLQNDGANNFTIVAVPTTQASHTTLANGDFDQVSTTQYSDQVLVAYNVTGYKVLTLNATALAALVGTGFNKIGVRNYTYDVVGTQPAINQTWMTTYYSEQTGTSNDPYYSLTYTVAAGGADDLLLIGVGR